MALKMKETDNAGLKKLPTVRRKTVNVSPEQLVSTGYLQPHADQPLVLCAALAEVDLAAWAARNREFVEQQLQQHGALLFRGFNVKTAGHFGQVCRAISGELLEYRERSSPRSEVEGNIYSSTDYPPDQSIFPHNEHSYSLTFPLRLYFFCETPATQGGETPLVDTRKVFRRLEARVKERFMEKKWMYVRNFGDGFGLDWQTVFQTTNREEVERYCRRAGIEVEWKEGNRLRTRQVREAVVRHPRTGELIWFNHITFFHVTTLGASIREPLLEAFSEEDLPNNSYYGDGSAIEPEVLEQLRAAYREEMVSFAWQAGDVLLLDNMLTAHARAPYSGARKILVAMAEPYTRQPDGQPPVRQ
jgi:alpha-ketoglutarate-dependent taurine dioxygenase